MQNLKIFCLCIHDQLLDKVKRINYTPVGLGQNEFKSGWLRDNTLKNISNKNIYYGEYSFHYWIWKNKIDIFEKKKWVGFCAYRRFFLKDNKVNMFETKFENKIIKEIPKSWDDYDVILAEKINLEKIKFIKILKYGKIALVKNPKSFFKSGRTIKFHFDMFHGNGVLDEAIKVLNKSDRDDFKYYVYNNNSFNQANMFICKSPQLLMRYYDCVFEWLFNCEKIFGLNLTGYGKIRLYAFLAERFLPFWFKKYSKCLDWPILFNDLRKENFK